MEKQTKPNTRRRQIVLGTGAAALTAGLPLRVNAQATGRIKIGYVSPQTGPLAPFGEADKFVLGGINAALKNGLAIGGKKYTVQIAVRDSQSNPNRAGEVAGELILKEKVDLMVVASTPETTNPVSDQCELNGVPCISTVAPWQPWYIGRQANPAGGPPAWKPFDWTYHFFWGLEDIIAVFTNMWNSLPSNKSIGGLFPNDGDGNAWGDKVVGFPPVLDKMGYKLTDPGRYQNLTQDFSAQIAAFKKANAEIVTGVVIPPDFKTFWTQAAQQGFKPKIVSVGKALLFPPSIEALGDLGNGLTTEVWWSPHHPFKSSLTGASAQKFAAAYEAATKKQWTQPIGFVHALFEVAVDALKRSGDPLKKAAVRDAIAATKLGTIVGPIAWSGVPFKNVAKTPLVGGQWVRGKTHKYELLIVNNETAKNIPTQAKIKSL